LLNALKPRKQQFTDLTPKCWRASTTSFLIWAIES